MKAKTPEQLLNELKAQPGVNITRQVKGTRVVVTTTHHRYELLVVDPENSIVEIKSSDPRLKSPAVGQFIHSSYDLEGTVSIEHWIGRSLRMHIRFQNGTLRCAAALSSRVEGDGWHFDVF